MFAIRNNHTQPIPKKNPSNQTSNKQVLIMLYLNIIIKLTSDVAYNFLFIRKFYTQKLYLNAIRTRKLILNKKNENIYFNFPFPQLYSTITIAIKITAQKTTATYGTENFSCYSVAREMDKDFIGDG